MDAAAWDARYRDKPLIWSAGPNRFLVEEADGLPPGSALDVACGEGRNALWLAEQGWQVTATDFSAEAIQKAGTLAQERGLEVDLRVADATHAPPAETFDLVIVFYLQPDAAGRRRAHRNAAAAVGPGGTLLIVGHDLDNLAQGVGGPPSPDVLLTVDSVVDDLDGTGLVIERASQVRRAVEQDDGTSRDAIDALLRARRPAGT